MISFNNIPTATRTPNVYTEVDPSRALQGLVQNPHKALIIGQKTSGSLPVETLVAITKDNLADGYFGTGSPLARMCNIFKKNNPNTELLAVAWSISTGDVHAFTDINLSAAMGDGDASVAGWWYLMINGEKCYVYISVGDSANITAGELISTINSNDNLPVTATVSDPANLGSGRITLTVTYSGAMGNGMDIRDNYYDGQVTPSCFTDHGTPSRIGDSVLSFEDGANTMHLGSVWAVVGNQEQYHYIIQPCIDATNLTELEGELEDRFLPLNDIQGHGFAATIETHAGCTSTGTARNSPHNTIMGIAGAPNSHEEWAAALGAVAAWNLNNDPARPLHFLKLKGLLPPRVEDRFSREERDILLFDGIATSIVDSGNNVLIERCITTYQKTALGTLDPTYLDIQTISTLGEIRYQYKNRMVSRFLIPRFKLADDTFPVQPGSKVATPSTVKMEIIALFTLLRDVGLIENLADFVDNLVVERNITDVTRVDVLLSPDLVNQFRILSGLLQFIL